MRDNKLAVEEARRVDQHESVKSEVERDVNAEIASRAAVPTMAEVRSVDAVAGELRGKAVKETIQVEREVDRARGAARGSQVVDYIFYVIYSLLAIRFMLALMAARPANGFVQFIHSITAPFYAPFSGIVATPSAEGGFTLALPVLIAIVVYMLLHAAINGLLRMAAHRKTAI